MAHDYIERRENGFYIAGSRIPLTVVVHEYLNGAPAESIRHSFPTLSLEQIHGALAFYHANEAALRQELHEEEDLWRRFRAEHPAPAELKSKLDQARLRLAEKR